eukprot:12121858-Heterocapsa_arctica.AAC.1
MAHPRGGAPCHKQKAVVAVLSFLESGPAFFSKSNSHAGHMRAHRLTQGDGDRYQVGEFDRSCKSPRGGGGSSTSENERQVERGRPPRNDASQSSTNRGTSSLQTSLGINAGRVNKAQASTGPSSW